MIAPTSDELADSPLGDTRLSSFDALYGAFRRARDAATEAPVRAYCVAGRIIHCRFAGDALVPLIQSALGHLEVEPALQPDATICLWDAASTGTLLPMTPWTFRSQGQRRATGESQRVRSMVHDECGAIWTQDRERNLALCYYPSAHGLPVYERAAPLRIVLHWCIESATVQVSHAGAVGLDGVGVVLAGKGGAGKSTTALTCLVHGMSYVGDDYVALDAGPVPTAWSLYRTAKLSADSLERLPNLGPQVDNPVRPPDDKALVFLNGRFESQTVTCLPIRAIVLPCVTQDALTSVRPISGAAATVVLAPGSIFYLPDAGAQAFHAITQFVKSVPSYQLRIGRDSSTIPDLISELVASG